MMLPFIQFAEAGSTVAAASGSILEQLALPSIWISLLTLTLLEIVLGIDNIIFISILSGKLPIDQQAKVRRIGLMLALITRILLLVSISWVMNLQNKLWDWELFGLPLPNTGKDLILFFGGLFLIFKSVKEIHEKLEGHDGDKTSRIVPTFAGVLIQILLLDVVFSLDSVITAVGMVKEIWIMITAVVAAVVVMLVFVNQISGFVDRHPTIKVLALSFLILIGVLLTAEGFGQHIPKGYVYFAMAFAVGVEVLNLRVRTKADKAADAVKLHQPYR
jgi:predicted tellurium resistance membrane protein TerC